MIEPVTQSNIMEAAMVHAKSWKESHRELCSAALLAAHTPERQKDYIEAEMAKGAKFYLLVDEKPVGIVSILGSLISNLYVLPSEQNKGYGTQLLAFAVNLCSGTPSLWILSTNDGAKRLYERSGFQPTGNVIQHSSDVLSWNCAKWKTTRAYWGNNHRFISKSKEASVICSLYDDSSFVHCLS